MVRHAAAAVALVFTLSPSWLSAQSTTFTVTTDSASVHKAPSTGSAVVGHVSRGRVLPVERELGSWVKVSWPEAEGGAGYVNVSWGKLGARSLAADPTRAVDSSSPRPAAQTPAAPSTPAAAVSRDAAPRAAVRPTYVTPASHALGLGARVGSSPMGFGAGARAWSRNRIGVQVDVSRYAMTSAVTPTKLTSTEIEPSVMVGLPDSVGDYLWVRPYVGSGVMIQRQSLDNGLPRALSTTSNGWGWQAFAGGEVTFAGAPQIAVSADIGYRRLNAPVEGFDLGGVGLSISAHWYMK